MRKILNRTLLLLLALALCLSVLCGCSAKGKTLLELDGETMSINMFRLYLSRMKGTVISSYAYEGQALPTYFWDTVMGAEGTTYNDYFTAQTLDSAKTYLAALALFKELGLKLPDSYIEEIDSEMARLLEEEANGSKNELNALLSPYGVNYKMLREAYIVEAKIAYLNDHLFGADGAKIAQSLIEDYYQKNYVRFKHVFLYNYEILYDQDEFGNDVYYTLNANGEPDTTRISYDKESGATKTGDDGEVIKDKNGHDVYFNEQGEVAYKKKNAARNPQLDAAGNQKIREYTAEELAAMTKELEDMMAQCGNGNYTTFDALVIEKSEDDGMREYENGYYMTRDTDYSAKNVLEEVFKMETGEMKIIHSDYGIHLVMKYQNDEAAYAKTENQNLFRKTDGSYVFMNDLKNQLYAEKLGPYKDKVIVNSSLLVGVDIKSIDANFYY
ncbi:MAG: hypothetical protein J6V42_01635 [Clostridia bacterium]|nr:hypothetical protein [Clostridia bacterium]